MLAAMPLEASSARVVGPAAPGLRVGPATSDLDFVVKALRERRSLSAPSDRDALSGRCSPRRAPPRYLRIATLSTLSVRARASVIVPALVRRDDLNGRGKGRGVFGSPWLTPRSARPLLVLAPYCSSWRRIARPGGVLLVLAAYVPARPGGVCACSPSVVVSELHAPPRCRCYDAALRTAATLTRRGEVALVPFVERRPPTRRRLRSSRNRPPRAARGSP
jgi:hypothetical protein